MLFFYALFFKIFIFQSINAHGQFASHDKKKSKERLIKRKSLRKLSSVTLHIIDLMFASSVEIQVPIKTYVKFKKFRFYIANAYVSHKNEPQNYEAHLIIEKQNEEGHYESYLNMWISSLYNRVTDPYLPFYWISIKNGIIENNNKI
jgi:hypothetical protein